VHSGTQARFKEGYRKIAEITNIANWNDPKADVVQLVTSWLCEESNGRWLMIIDNADDASVFFHNTASRAAYKSDTTIVEPPVSTFLPYTSHGSILITSRSREVACRLTRTEKSIVEVGPMDRQEAFALLQKKFTSPVYREEADALIDALGHMPLALTQAAAFINRTPRMSISQYLKDIEHSQAHLLKKNMVDIRRDAQASNSIMTTWQISFEHIRERSPAAARLLSLMCLFDQQAIPKKLLQGRYGGHENERSHFENDIYILTSFSFVKASADKSSFEMHSLVQYATKRWLEHSCELESWKGVYMALIDDKYPIGRPENWPVCQALYPHAQVALDDHPFSADALENWASISWKAAWYMGEMGDYEKAYKLALDSFDIRTILLGPDDPDTLDSLNTVGVALSRLRRYDEAKIMYQRAVEGKKRTLGAEHLDTLTSMLNLAIVYDSQGHWIDAERLLKQILEVASKKDWEAGRSLTLSTLTTLATTYRNLGRYTEAADSELQILEAREAQLGPDYPTTLTVKGNLAYTYRHLGRLKEAEELNLQVLSAHEQNHHAEIEILATKAHLASIYKEQGRWLEAETLQREVLDTTTTKLGPNHPDTLYAMGNLAGTYWTQGRFSEAEALQLQLLDLRRSILGDQHPSTLDTKASLAVTYWSQNRFSEAETLKLEVLHIRKEKLGDEHPLTLDSKTSLASTYREQGRLGDAEVLDTEVLNVRMEKLGAEHPSTLGSMGNLAVTLRRLGGVERAYELMGKCYEGHVRVLGVEHPLTAKYREGLEKWRRADEQKE
jgi:tetratricopeptide (TPR) repeat protein